MRGQILGLFASLALLPVLVGCHRPPAGPPLADPHPVHGKIVFPNKTPLKGGMVTFTPKDFDSGENGWVYEVSGLVDSNGNYALGMGNDGSGAAIGEYTVKIEPRELEIPNSNSKLIPSKYSSYASPLSATVKEGDNVINFELQ